MKHLSDIKLAEIFAIMCINLRQAQIEGSININMAGQTILAKLPKKMPNKSNASQSDNRLEYLECFKGVFDLVCGFFD